MMQRRRVGGLWIVVALGLFACEPIVTLSTTGAAQSPREPGCDFPVLIVPADGYVEIGVIEFEGRFWANQKLYIDVNEVKNAIRADVCKAGGDAALALSNGQGEYTKVTILKRSSGGSTVHTVSTSAVTEPAAPTPTAAATDLGCHYDTQCKGDRVCNAGQCVAPAPVLSPAASTSAKSAPSALPPRAP